MGEGYRIKTQRGERIGKEKRKDRTGRGNKLLES